MRLSDGVFWLLLAQSATLAASGNAASLRRNKRRSKPRAPPGAVVVEFMVDTSILKLARLFDWGDVDRERFATVLFQTAPALQQRRCVDLAMRAVVRKLPAGQCLDPLFDECEMARGGIGNFPATQQSIGARRGKLFSVGPASQADDACGMAQRRPQSLARSHVPNKHRVTA